MVVLRGVQQEIVRALQWNKNDLKCTKRPTGDYSSWAQNCGSFDSIVQEMEHFLFDTS